MVRLMCAAMYAATYAASASAIFCLFAIGSLTGPAWADATTSGDPGTSMLSLQGVALLVDNVTVAAIAEPVPLLLFLSGLGLMVLARRYGKAGSP